MATRKPRSNKELPEAEVPDTPQESLSDSESQNPEAIQIVLGENFLKRKDGTIYWEPKNFLKRKRQDGTIYWEPKHSNQIVFIVGQAPVEMEPLPPQARSTLKLAEDVLEKPALWLRTPNPRLGDRKPIDLLDTAEEHKVRDILIAADQGLFG